MSAESRELPHRNGKSPDRKPEYNDRRSSPHPRQERSLVGQMVPRAVGIGIRIGHRLWLDASIIPQPWQSTRPALQDSSSAPLETHGAREGTQDRCR